MTGLSRMVIVEFKGADLRPRVSIKDKKGKTAKVPGSSAVAAIFCPWAPISSSLKATRYGLATFWRRFPERRQDEGHHRRSASCRELFEAGNQGNAVISEIRGIVSYGKDAKGKRKVIITPDSGEEKDISSPGQTCECPGRESCQRG